MICNKCGCSVKMSTKRYQVFDETTEAVYCNKCFKQIKQEAISLVEALA